jgi:hypothetical protein
MHLVSRHTTGLYDQHDTVIKNNIWPDETEYSAQKFMLQKPAYSQQRHKTLQWRKDTLFNKWWEFWKTGHSYDLYLSFNTKINLKIDQKRV